MINSMEQLDRLAEIIMRATHSLLSDNNDQLIGQPRQDIENIQAKTVCFKKRVSQFTPNTVPTEHYRHELRAPLNSMIGFSELMLHDKDATLTIQQQHLVTNIHESSLSITKILDELFI